MKIVGHVSNAEEAKEIESITKSFVVGGRARALALKTNARNKNKSKNQKR